jgi:uncharacterized membrane-anchored protein
VIRGSLAAMSTVVFINVSGTLSTDTLTDRFNVSLIISTVGFAIALAATSLVWHRRLLDADHTTDQTPRELASA